MLGRIKQTGLIIALSSFCAFTSPAIAQTSVENPLYGQGATITEFASRCFDRKSYTGDVVEICMACDGRILVNGVPVALKDMDTLLIQLKSVPQNLRFKVTAKTDVELGAYLALKNLIEKHKIEPDYRVSFASRRSLCR